MIIVTLRKAGSKRQNNCDSLEPNLRLFSFKNLDPIMALALFILEDRCSFSDRASQNFLDSPPLSVRILSGWSGPLTVAVPVLYYVLSEVGMPKNFGCCNKGIAT